jgi:hypothetical protein
MSSLFTAVGGLWTIKPPSSTGIQKLKILRAVTRKPGLTPTSHIHKDTRTTSYCLWRELMTKAAFCLISSLWAVLFPAIEISICEAGGTQNWSQVLCYIGGWGRQLRKAEVHTPCMPSGNIGPQDSKPSSVIIDSYHVLKAALSVSLNAGKLQLALLDVRRFQFESWLEIAYSVPGSDYQSPQFFDWARGSIVVEALCYITEGRGFDARWGEFLNLPNPSGRTRPLTKMSTREIKIIMFLGSKVRPVRSADNLTFICEPIV